MRDPFPEVLDNTALAGFANCRKYFEWQQVRRIVPKGTSIHLTAGAAFARGLEVTRRAFFDQHTSSEDAIALGVAALWAAYGDLEVPTEGTAAAKTWQGVTRAFLDYFETWPLGIDLLQPAKLGDSHAIEFNFCLPLPINHPTTGQPILYTGRFDMIGEVNNALYAVDEKTAGARRSVNWSLRSQFMGYVWAAQQHGLPVAGTYIRKVIIHKDDTVCEQYIAFAPEWVIKRWLDQTVKRISQAIECWRGSYFDYNLSDACNLYGSCPYARLCSVENPEPWIQIDYTPNLWNPLTREEMTV